MSARIPRRALAVASLAWVACAPTHRGDFTLLASRVVPAPFQTVYGQRVQGRACDGTKGWNERRIERAVADALKQQPDANALSLVKLWYDTGIRCLVVEGTPVVLR